MIPATSGSCSAGYEVWLYFRPVIDMRSERVPASPLAERVEVGGVTEAVDANSDALLLPPYNRPPPTLSFQEPVSDGDIGLFTSLSVHVWISLNCLQNIAGEQP